MGSEALGPRLAMLLGPEGIGLLVAAAAAALGAAASSAIKSYAERGTDRGRRLSIASMILASFALVPAVAAFIAIVGHGSVPSGTALYAGIGAAVGLAAGAFPAAAGAPLVAAAALALSYAAAQASGTEPWKDGATVARLVVFSATADATLCRVEAVGGPDRELRLPPGPISFELRVLSTRGPFKAFTGGRRYSLEAVAAGGTRTAWPPGRAQAFVPPSALGFGSSALSSAPFEPEDHLSATLRLGPGTAATVELR